MHQSIVIVERPRDDDRVGSAYFGVDQAMYEFGRTCLKLLRVDIWRLRGPWRIDDDPSLRGICAWHRQELVELCPCWFLFEAHLFEVPANIASLRVRVS